MALLRYVGAHDEVYVQVVGVYARRDGDPVDIPDEGVAASLLAQETWVKADHPDRYTGPGAKSSVKAAPSVAADPAKEA